MVVNSRMETSERCKTEIIKNDWKTIMWTGGKELKKNNRCQMETGKKKPARWQSTGNRMERKIKPQQQWRMKKLVEDDR